VHLLPPGELEEAAAVRQTSRPGMVPEASEPDLYDFSRPFCMVGAGGGVMWGVGGGKAVKL
jgi:hypothetical protein